eukprot:CAMPEP_0114348432 /NCGR_PEP_ID=MMETSP0101-20121206/14694_1 /TAXON_ID=38822 ORGANISM="Pteridomonas danica, Strain PT" /NCGR_SAMPLE_ID=MMETSP0101 /ASSEMBLY_ACC=CAM_ASM_000211 /LENGTH=65 /DNA_ID=CAMNT_0001486335 /DNA_START=325 /DNA_END=518 /DNA_ORIENTATION=+
MGAVKIIIMMMNKKIRLNISINLLLFILVLIVVQGKSMHRRLMRVELKPIKQMVSEEVEDDDHET